MSLAKMDLTDWPEIQALADCPQDPEWHAEGNVLIHTDMVLAECAAIERELDCYEHGVFRLSCLLHDIEKPKVTTYDEVIKHTIAPGHERMGGVSSRYLLREMNIPSQERRLISQLVATHHLVKRAVQNIDKEGGKAFLERLAARVDTKLLWALELADMRGRTSADRANQIEIVQLFKMLCEEMNCFGKAPTPWLTEEDVKGMPFEDSLSMKYALEETHRRRLLGQMTNKYEAEAFCWNYAKNKEFPAQVIIMVGASGSGKSQYINHKMAINQNPPWPGNDVGWDVVSTDAIRKELYGDESAKGDGEVFQLANERLRQCFRIHGRVVYDATNTIPDFRKKVVDLCHDYGAYVTLYVFDLSKEELKERNKQRDRQVPEEVINRQCAKFEWPLPEEAHKIRIIE
ncbi:MAG TPA: AAA family ATPase [Anaerovoracaceae bacterium]|nr:AAA family ATPase [Anaerovoracaceae bacterium]